MLHGKQYEVRKADEFIMAEVAPILGWVRPLLAEVFCGSGGYCRAVLSDVSLPKLHTRGRQQWLVHEFHYLVGHHHGKLILSSYE